MYWQGRIQDFLRGGRLRSTSQKKGGGGPGGGPTLVQMLKSLYSGSKVGGGHPAPPGSPILGYEFRVSLHCKINENPMRHVLL